MDKTIYEAKPYMQHYSIMICNKKRGMFRVETAPFRNATVYENSEKYPSVWQSILSREVESAEWDMDAKEPVFYITVEDDCYDEYAKLFRRKGTK